MSVGSITKYLKMIKRLQLLKLLKASATSMIWINVESLSNFVAEDMVSFAG